MRSSSTTALPPITSTSPNWGRCPMERKEKIFVAGHRGLVGSAIRRELDRQGYQNALLSAHSELDFDRQVDHDQVFSASARITYSWPRPGWESLWVLYSQSPGRSFPIGFMSLHMPVPYAQGIYQQSYG